MANVLALSIGQIPNTFTRFRNFLKEKGYSNENIIKLEGMSVNEYAPRCIKFIEAHGLNFNEIMNYFHYERPDVNYESLLSIAIIGTFRKLENNDTNFNVF